MRLKELREENKYTQQYVAEILNIRQNTYSQYTKSKAVAYLEYVEFLPEQAKGKEVK